MKLNDKLDNLNLNNLELKGMLKLAKHIRNNINFRIEESNPKNYGLCIHLYYAIPKCNCYPGSYVEYFKQLFPDEKYDIDGKLLENGLFRFTIDKSDENPIKGFYKYRLIWLEELITLLEAKI